VLSSLKVEAASGNKDANNRSDPNKVFLFISEDYSFLGDPGDTPSPKPGKFGNFANITRDVGGLYRYGAYGLGTFNTTGSDATKWISTAWTNAVPYFIHLQ
jgi:hypothetical protein